MKKIHIGGINEIKYPIRNNHASAAVCIQPETKEMIKRGIAKITSRVGVINRCLCCRSCSSKIFR